MFPKGMQVSSGTVARDSRSGTVAGGQQWVELPNRNGKEASGGDWEGPSGGQGPLSPVTGPASRTPAGCWLSSWGPWESVLVFFCLAMF